MSNPAPERNIKLRSPNKQDIDQIFYLLTSYAKEELLLALTKTDIAERLTSFIVAVDASKVIGCAAIKDFGDNLYEIRSLAVNSDYIGEKIGSKMVKHLIATVTPKPNTRIFALTYRATFFEYLGFKHVDKELFPQKIWSDCSKCPKQNNCDEEALMLTF